MPRLLGIAETFPILRHVRRDARAARPEPNPLGQRGLQGLEAQDANETGAAHGSNKAL